jgi:pilus assembly protein CpaB
VNDGRWPPADARRALRRAYLRHRRGLRAGLVVIGTAAALGVVAPAPPPTLPVVVATADLPSGRVLTAQDVALAPYASAQVPAGAYQHLDDVVGQTITGPMRRSEPLTDARMTGAAALIASNGLVEAPVRLADAGAAMLLHTGDVVDVLAAVAEPAVSADALAAAPTTPGERMAAVVASAARVLAVPDLSGTDATGADGALVLLAVSPATARVLAAAAATSRLSVVIGSGRG